MKHGEIQIINNNYYRLRREKQQQAARQKRIEQVTQTKLSIMGLVCSIIYILVFMYLAFGY